MKDDLQASNELVAEVNEKLVKTVEVNTKALDELNAGADAQLIAVNKLAQSVADYSISRHEELRRKIEEQKPIVHYSDKVDEKPEVKELVQPVSTRPEKQKVDQPENTKFKRQNEGSGIVNAIGKMGMDIARSISTAAKDFTGNIVDTLGNEILPLYPQLKQAVTTVGSGVAKAAETGYSAFQRVRGQSEQSEKKTVEKSETKSVFERITNNGVQREKTTKVLAIQQAHRDHKLLKKVDDIYDFMKLQALFGVLKFAAIGAFFSGIGGLITTIVTTLSGLFLFFKDKIFTVLESMGSKLSELISGLKDFGKKAVEGAKELVNDVKRKLGFGGDETKPVIDKDGKPKLDKNGKPIEAKPLETVDGKESKFGKPVEPTVEKPTPKAAGKGADVAVKPNKAASLAGEAVETAVEKKGKSAIAGEIMTTIGSMTSGLSKLAGLMMRGLGVVGWVYTGYEAGSAVADVDSHPESVKRANRYLSDSGSMNDPMMMQAGIEPDSVAVEQSGESLKRAETEREIRKEQRQATQTMINSPMNIQNNSTTYASEPFRFASDTFSQPRPHGSQVR